MMIALAVAAVAAVISTASASTERVVLEPRPGSAIVGCELTVEGCYNVPMLTVPVGTTIAFSNTDSVAHTIASGSPTDGMTGVFGSGLVLAGATYEFTVHEKGTYDYYCLVHPWMTGTIVVGGEADEGAIDQPHATPETADTAVLEDRIRALEARVAALEATIERLSGGQAILTASEPLDEEDAKAMIYEALVRAFIEGLNEEPSVSEGN